MDKDLVAIINRYEDDFLSGDNTALDRIKKYEEIISRVIDKWNAEGCEREELSYVISVRKSIEQVMNM